MKSIINTTALMVLLLGQFITRGAEPVTGMFGVNLGDTLDSAAALSRNVVTGGAVKYEIKVNSPHKSFQTYEVEVTTGSKKIHTITATGRYPGKESAMQVYTAVKAELEAKYGPAKTNRREGAAYFGAGQRSVALVVNETRAAVAFLVLTCKDDELTPLAEKEAVPVPVAPPPEEIEGAFGLKFGSVIDPSKAIATVKSSSGETLYQVKSPTPNSYFDKYYVAVTPDTKKIYLIWVIGPVRSEAEGKVRRDSLAKTIESKYQMQRDMLDTEFARILRKGDKLISLKTSYQSGAGYQLEVRYTNLTLQKASRGEAVDRNMKNLDSKGL